MNNIPLGQTDMYLPWYARETINEELGISVNLYGEKDNINDKDTTNDDKQEQEQKPSRRRSTDRRASLSKRFLFSKRRLLIPGEVVKGNFGYDFAEEDQQPHTARCPNCVNEKPRERKGGSEPYFRLCFGGCDKLVWDIYERCLDCAEKDDRCPYCSETPWILKVVDDLLTEGAVEEMEIEKLLRRLSTAEIDFDEKSDYAKINEKEGETFNIYAGATTSDSDETEDFKSQEREPYVSKFGRALNDETAEILEIIQKSRKKNKEIQPGHLVKGTKGLELAPSYKLPTVVRCTACKDEVRRRKSSIEPIHRVCRGGCGYLVHDIHDKCIDCAERDNSCPTCGRRPFTPAVVSDEFFKHEFRESELERATTHKKLVDTERRNSKRKSVKFYDDGIIVGSKGLDVVPDDMLPLKARCVKCCTEHRKREANIEPCFRKCNGLCNKLVWDIHRMCLPCSKICDQCPFCLASPYIFAEEKYIDPFDPEADSEEEREKVKIEDIHRGKDYRRLKSFETINAGDIVIGNGNGRYPVCPDYNLPHTQRCKSCVNIVRERYFEGSNPALRLCKGGCDYLIFDIYHRCLPCAKAEAKCPFCSANNEGIHRTALDSEDYNDTSDLIDRTAKRSLRCRQNSMTSLKSLLRFDDEKTDAD